jgi:ribosome biogenesis GTPase
LSETATLPTLEQLGWTPHFAAAFEQLETEGVKPGRVAVQHSGAYDLYTEDGELRSELSGRLRHDAGGAGDLPAVGDWVAYRPSVGESGGHATIHAVLPRATKFSRKTAWAETEEQVVAANVDSVFLVSSMNSDLNLRRLERYLTLAWESGALPAVVLTKADLSPDVAAEVAEVERVAFGTPIHPVSNVTGEGLDELAPYFTGNRTVALLGSSGVGKSTLINRLVGEELLLTKEIRADGRGRHTTTWRELVLLPGGGLVLDTPGMRELQLWTAGEGIGAAFTDVEELAATCRFNDCEHRTEPGCAVIAAIESGDLEAERLESYRKLLRELQALELRQDQRLQAEAKRKRRVQARSYRKAAW